MNPKDSFGDRLMAAIIDRESRVVLGLDPHLQLFPPPLADAAASTDRETVAEVVERFCMEVLEAASEVVAAVKPQIAFFERLGPPGWAVLERLCKRARGAGLLVIADAKRGDIGSTAKAYAGYLLGTSEGLGGLDADAMTASPYLGSDSLAAYLPYLSQGKGLFVLAKTSNPSSADLQDRMTSGPGGDQPMYSAVGALVQKLSPLRGDRGYSPLGLVVGATSPSQAQSLREAFPDLPFLVPGYGAQGASAEDVVSAFDRRGLGAVVNASRSLVFAYRAEEYSQLAPSQWAVATRRECERMTRDINEALAKAGRLEP
jgi:orotidine-5'-phosphate decarboxylase